MDHAVTKRLAIICGLVEKHGGDNQESEAQIAMWPSAGLRKRQELRKWAFQLREEKKQREAAVNAHRGMTILKRLKKMVSAVVGMTSRKHQALTIRKINQAKALHQLHLRS